LYLDELLSRRFNLWVCSK